jgi:hypothetical protein
VTRVPQLLTDGMFVVIFLASLVELARRRDLPRLEIAALFGTVAPLAALQALGQLGVGAPPWLAMLSLLVFLGQPYALLRVTEHFRAVPRAQHVIALGGLVASWLV